MTRKEELAARARDYVSLFVMSGAEPAAIKNLAWMLQQVEREVWEKVAKHLEAEAVKSLALEHKLMRRGNVDNAADVQSQRFTEEAYTAWARAQQQELGS